jgi:hypothetical protein
MKISITTRTTYGSSFADGDKPCLADIYKAVDELLGRMGYDVAAIKHIDISQYQEAAE